MSLVWGSSGRSRTAALGLALMVVASAEPVAAQGSQGEQQDGSEQGAGDGRSEKERDRLERARNFMERGQELFLQEKYGKAADKFEQAYETMPHSVFVYNAAVARERAGNLERAAELFSRYLEEAPHASDADSVRERVERLRTELQDTAPGGTAAGAPSADEADTGETAEPAEGAEEAEPSEQGEPAEGAEEAEPSEQDEPAEGAEQDEEDQAAGESGEGEAAAESDEAETDDQGKSEGASDTGEQGGAQAGGTAAAAPGAKSAAARKKLEMKSLLSVETDPEGARVTVHSGDERVASGGAPLMQTLQPGTYQLRIEHQDFESIEREISVRPGAVYYFIVDMRQGDFMGALRVVTRPPGAKVFIDDREQGAFGETPFLNAVTVGKHHVWIKRPGYKTVERDIEVEFGSQETMRVQLERVEYGKVRVVANVSNARVFIDDERVGKVPYRGEVSPGTHQVRVEADDMKDWESQVEVRRGQVTPVRVKLKPAVGRGGAWASAIISAGLVGGGVALTMLGDNIEQELDEDAMGGRLASNDSRMLKGRVYTIAGDVAFGLAGVAAIVATYYFLYDPLPDSEATLLEPRDWAVVPQLGPRRAGAQLKWSF